mmetsp:Transcript_101312/g.291882  ORF Transcript_101312/g.291882 Transcript_101312/m.291882 type:complete len:404 (-) Transcript_101312:142-1353(-)|eukprot:CAMPEP_0170276412 /NCGR_PEP_ID=MMETSP0116_2-20130129/38190_1 /TAXON_ID=400756 /ORGANISM="Durinskia baltica, Strain CSIRO CS-38" /LENGTH=403 /DNA_ID=CAMNT_0010527683 /DNA_START=69 /DNA_END=1280 /DNA_ORIENTATION=-
MIARCMLFCLFLTCLLTLSLPVEGFLVPRTNCNSQVKNSVAATATATARHSTSSRSPYSTVDNSGPTWTGQRWEGRAPTYEEQFAQSRREQGLQNFPRQRESAPMVRYSALSEQEKAAIAAANTGRSASAYSAYYSPNPPPLPAVRMPENAQEIQGGSRGTWVSDASYNHDEVQVTMATDGRPLRADVEVYQGPDNTPQRMRVFSEDGRLRPFTTMIATPQGAAKTASLFWNNQFRSPTFSTGGSHSISIRNTGPIEFPIIAGVEGKGATSIEERASSMTDYSGRSMGTFLNRKEEIHGGHLRTYPFDPSVASVEVRIVSQGLPIMAMVELWQGPGDVKTVAQVYCDDGQTKPFSAIIETPGAGNTIAIRNMGPTAYPIEAILQVHTVDNSAYSYAYGAYGGY